MGPLGERVWMMSDWYGCKAFTPKFSEADWVDKQQGTRQQFGNVIAMSAPPSAYVHISHSKPKQSTAQVYIVSTGFDDKQQIFATRKSRHRLHPKKLRTE